MTELSSFRSVIEFWETREAMAVETGATPSQVSKWWQRDSIPSEWWSSVLASKTAFDAGLTAEQLIGLASRAPQELSVEMRL